MSLLVAGILLFDIAATREVQLDGMSQLVRNGPGLLLLGLALWFCHWRPLPRFVDSCENAIWAILLTNLLSVMIQVAGRSPCPLVDAQLAHLDRFCHFDTASIAHLAARLPALQFALSLTYNLVSLLILAALLLPPFVGQPGASRRYLVALVLATFITAVLFALWPAAGPWTSESLVPSELQLQVTRYLALLKSHSRVTMDFGATAIVSFPSFHVVLAILSATALSGISRIRVAAWVFAALTCVSTLTTGWHYGVDLAGGFAVAAMAQLGARAVCAYLEGGAAETSSVDREVDATNRGREPLPGTAI